MFTIIFTTGGSKERKGRGPPLGLMSFIFSFRYKILSSNRLAHSLLGMAHPPLGNPGSATFYNEWCYFVIVDQLDKISPYSQIFLIKWRNILNLSLWSSHIDKNRHGFKWNDFPERNLFRTLSRLLLQDSDQWTKSHTHSTTSTTFMLTFLVPLFKVYSKKNTFMWQLDVE